MEHAVGAWSHLPDVDCFTAEQLSSLKEPVRCLAHGIFAQIDLLHANAAAARDAAASLPTANGEALLEAIENMLAKKLVALEEEGVEADQVLELIDRVLSEISLKGLVATPEQTTTIRTAVQVLSAAPVEPADLFTSMPLGVLVAPRGIRAEGVSLVCASSVAMPGAAVVLELALAAHVGSAASHEELQLMLVALARHTRVRASTASSMAAFTTSVEPRHLLSVSMRPDPSRRCLLLFVAIPPELSVGSYVMIEDVIVAGHSIGSSATLPVVFRVTRGIKSPQIILSATTRVPCAGFVTSEGALWAPTGDLDVSVWAADGTCLAPMQLPVASRADGLAVPSAHVGAIALDEAACILVALHYEGGRAQMAPRRSRMRSFEISTPGKLTGWILGSGGKVPSLAWTQELWSTNAIALLPGLGPHGDSICVSTSFTEGLLRIVRIRDGVELATAPARHPTYIAADTEERRVYVSVHHPVGGEGCIVEAWDIRVGAAGNVSLEPHALSVPVGGFFRASQSPIVVVRSGGKVVPDGSPVPASTAHLIVGNRAKSGLVVLTLPGLEKVFEHSMDEGTIAGLAADPTGTALVAFTSKGDARVLPWPLPGM